MKKDTVYEGLDHGYIKDVVREREEEEEVFEKMPKRKQKFDDEGE